MESIEKLRDFANENIINGKLMNAMIDEIEREIAERYMELPVDADGVPIHVGDELETANGGKVIVEYVGECEVRVYRDGEHYRVSQDEYASICRHVKPDPVKELLEKLVRNVYGSYDLTAEQDRWIDECAASIREVVGA